MKASRWSRWRLLLLSWAIALGIGVLVVWQLLDSRGAIWQRSQAANTNLLFTVSHVLERTFDVADRALRHSVTVLERSAAGGGPASSDWRAAVHGVNADVLFAGVSDQGFGIQVVLDEHGRLVASSSTTPRADVRFDQRDYFTTHERQADAGLFIGRPFVSTYDGRLSMAMSRRWNHPDGSFGGIVVQTFKLSVLHHLFSSFELAPDSGIDVFLRDGTMVTRFPYVSEPLDVLGGVAERPELRKPDGVHNYRGVATDGVERLYVSRPLDRFPLIVSVAQSTRSILSDWVNTAVWLGGATLILMLACVGLAVLAERGMRAHRRTAQRLAQAEHDLRMVLDSLPVLVAYWDKQLINRMSNTAHLHWFGLEPEQMQGRHVSELIGDDLYRIVRPHLDAALAGDMQMFELDIPDAKGVLRHTVTTYIPDWDHGRVKGVFVLVTDISERKAAETALLDEKERFRIILESIKDGVITTDSAGRILYLNPAAAALTGWGLEEARGEAVERIMETEISQEGEHGSSLLRDALEKRRAFNIKVEHVLVSRSGDRIPIENSAAPILDEQGGLRGAVVIFHEVGQVRAMANQMAHLAQHDALTGLPNRRRLDQIGRQMLSLAHAEQRRLAVLYLDLDGFKRVNDEYGHAVGDELLMAVTRRLSARLRPGDAIYRQGGDEFVVLMDGLETIDEAERLAARLIESCRSPVRVSGRELAATVSVGISVFPDDAPDFDGLIQRADRAMYVAKKSGRNCYKRAGGVAVALEDGPSVVSG